MLGQIGKEGLFQPRKKHGRIGKRGQSCRTFTAREVLGARKNLVGVKKETTERLAKLRARRGAKPG